MKRFVCLVLAAMMLMVAAVPAGAVTFGEMAEQQRLERKAKKPETLFALFLKIYDEVKHRELIGESMEPFTPDPEDGAAAEGYNVGKASSLIMYMDQKGGHIIGLELTTNVHLNAEAAAEDIEVLHTILYEAILPEATEDELAATLKEMTENCVNPDGGYAAEYTKMIDIFSVTLAKEEQHIDILGESLDLYYVTLNIITIPQEEDSAAAAAFKEGFEEAEYTKYASNASENGLGGTRIWVEGTLEHTELLMLEDEEIENLGVIMGYLQTEDGNKWLVSMHIAPIVVRENYYEDFVGKQVIMRGVYDGYSAVAQMPVFTLDQVMDEQTEETVYGMATFTGAMEEGKRLNTKKSTDYCVVSAFFDAQIKCKEAGWT